MQVFQEKITRFLQVEEPISSSVSQSKQYSKQYAIMMIQWVSTSGPSEWPTGLYPLRIITPWTTYHRRIHIDLDAALLACRQVPPRLHCHRVDIVDLPVIRLHVLPHAISAR